MLAEFPTIRQTKCSNFSAFTVLQYDIFIHLQDEEEVPPEPGKEQEEQGKKEEAGQEENQEVNREAEDQPSDAPDTDKEKVEQHGANGKSGDPQVSRLFKSSIVRITKQHSLTGH